MKKYVFIITDRNRNNLHVGMSANIIGTMNFYRKMPNLFFDSGQQLTRLVYFEELNTQAEAEQRFRVINRFTRPQKEKMIRAVNTDWIDLTPGLNYEQLKTRTLNAQSVLSFAS